MTRKAFTDAAIRLLEHVNLIFLCSLTLAMLFPWSLLVYGGEPRLICEEPEYDYGTVDNTRDIIHTFVLGNGGDAPLIISNTRATCGCTRLALSTNIIEPGAFAKLEGRLILRGYNGPKRSSIYIHSNDPFQPVFQLQFAGIASAEVGVNPPVVTVESDASLIVSDQFLTISSRAAKPLAILSFTSRGDHFSAMLTTNKPGTEFTVAVHFSDAALPGDHVGSIVIATDHPAYPRIEVPVRLILLGQLAVMPAALNLPRTGPDARHRYLVLRNRKQQDFKLLHFSADDTLLPITLQSSKSFWYRLRVGPYPADGPSTATTIRITTDLTNLPTIQVPVTIAR